MGPVDQALEFARLTGMKAAANRAFGRYQGQVACVQFEAVGPVVMQLKAPRNSIPPLLEAAKDKELLHSLGIPPGTLQVDPEYRRLTHNFAIPLGASANLEEVKQRLGGLCVLAHRAGPGLNDRCSECEAQPGVPMVINGRVFQLCPACYNNLVTRNPNGRATGAAAQPNVARGVLFGILGMLGGAVLWGVIVVATGLILGLVAIVFGYIVAYSIHKGAGTVTNGLIGLAVALTMLTVFVGFFFAVLFEAIRLGAPLGVVPSVYGYVLTNSGSDLGFGLIVGLFGAWGAANWLRRAKGRTVPPLDVVT